MPSKPELRPSAVAPVGLLIFHPYIRVPEAGRPDD